LAKRLSSNLLIKIYAQFNTTNWLYGKKNLIIRRLCLFKLTKILWFIYLLNKLALLVNIVSQISNFYSHVTFYVGKNFYLIFKIYPRKKLNYIYINFLT